MTYEPRAGDLVTDHYGQTNEIVARPETCIDIPARAWVRLDSGGAPGAWHCDPATLAPIRPDAPGQRVRGCVGGFSAGVTREAMHDPLRDRRRFYVEWDAGGSGPWGIDRLIRIADHTAKTCAPPEAPPTEDARKESGYQTAPAAINPTCQHCGSGIVAGLLRDACPRGCDLTLRAKEPEPEIEVRWFAFGGGGECGWGGHGAEPAFAIRLPRRTEDGRTHVVHPTREGAITAWREAVRR